MEIQILDMLQRLHTPVLDQIMVWITRMGDAGIIWILFAVALLFFPKTRKAGILVSLALILEALLCNCLLKPLVDRMRPFEMYPAVELLIRPPVDPSFPSGHTAAGFAALTALLFSKQKRWWTPVFLLAAAIAFSRLYLYVHYPTDVLGGIAAGVLSGCVAGWIVERFDRRRKYLRRRYLARTRVKKARVSRKVYWRSRRGKNRIRRFTRLMGLGAVMLLILWGEPRLKESGILKRLPDVLTGWTGLNGDYSASLVDSSPSSIPDHAGADVIELNGNRPLFNEYDRAKISGESFSRLDWLGRCGTAVAMLDRSMMPTQERGSIGQVKPSGWKQAKYPGLVNSQPPYLFNRCHLIAYALTGQNANEKNLITGTRYMNAELMLPYELQVARYLDNSDHHVLYRVSPYFKGNELVARGVEIEAYSVEDHGAGVSFHVFVYNVQPGVGIDYATGESWIA